MIGKATHKPFTSLFIVLQNGGKISFMARQRRNGRKGSSGSQQCYQTPTPRLIHQPLHWQGNVRRINVWWYRVGGLNMSWSEERRVSRLWGGGGHRCESSVISKSVRLSVSGKPAEPRGVATLYLDTFFYWEETVWMYLVLLLYEFYFMNGLIFEVKLLLWLII